MVNYCWTKYLPHRRMDHPKELISMPAVTVDNILTLPRVAEPDAGVPCRGRCAR